jgi:hypothetical protein
MDARAAVFRALAPDELEDWAAERAAEAELVIADAWLPAVLENLAGVQAHSRRVADALRAAEDGHATEAGRR